MNVNVFVFIIIKILLKLQWHYSFEKSISLQLNLNSSVTNLLLSAKYENWGVNETVLRWIIFKKLGVSWMKLKC